MLRTYLLGMLSVAVLSKTVPRFCSRLSSRHLRNRLSISVTVPSLNLHSSRRTHDDKGTTDEKIAELQDLYTTAKDEFEIAHDETEKKTVYAADDRATAREELTKLQTAYRDAIEQLGEERGHEVKTRVEHRIRELNRAVEAMEERAKGD